jgi:hypothetical protein
MLKNCLHFLTVLFFKMCPKRLGLILPDSFNRGNEIPTFKAIKR